MREQRPNDHGDAIDSELIAILRYSNKADPLYCECGEPWGMHGLTAMPPLRQACDSFRYDFGNSENAVKNLRDGYSLVRGGKLVMPYAA